MNLKKWILIACCSVLMISNKANADFINFRFSPLLALIGTGYVHLDFALGGGITLGPTATFGGYEMTSDGFRYRVTANSFGGRLNWHTNGTFKDGLYIGAQAVTSTVKVEETATNVSGEAKGSGITGLIGYGWFWNSFNQMLGFGIANSTGDGEIVIRDPNGVITDRVDYPSSSGFALEYSLGWKF